MDSLQYWSLFMMVLLGSLLYVSAGSCFNQAGCNNRGTCDGTDCTCDPGYTGYNCENACSTNADCNGGTCSDGSPGKACNCPATKYGQQCENDQICASNNDCQNGGTCDETAEVHVCVCAQGYTGTTCRDACSSDSDCNGGTCSAQSPRTCSPKNASTNKRLSTQLLVLFMMPLMYREVQTVW